MPSYNVGAYIEKCIESVISQTMRDIEIICIDAGSTDGTLEILENDAAKDEWIRLLHYNVKSYDHQMNMGLASVYGEYIGIVKQMIPLLRICTKNCTALQIAEKLIS